MFRVSFFLVAAVSVAACSLVVSTDGLAGDPITRTTDAEAGPTESGAADAASDGDGGGELEPAGCPDLHGLSTTSPWPMVGGCPSQPGRSGVVGPANATKVRSFAQAPAGASFASGVIAADGTVYIGVEDVKGVCAYNPDGTVKWCGSQDNSDAVALGTDQDVYANSGQGLTRVVPATGEVRWRYATTSEVDVPPVIARNGNIYWADYEGNVGAVRPDGTSAWIVSIAGHQDLAPGGPALGASGSLYLTVQGALVSLADDGSLRWRYTANGATSSPVVDSKEGVYFGAGDGSLHSVSPEGARRWRKDLAAGAVGPPAVGRDRTLYVGTDSGRVVALSSEGAVLWQKNLSSAIVGQPLLDGNARLYVLTSEPAIHALASFDGSELWSDGLAAQANGAMALTAAGALIVVQRTATIRAYER